MILVQALGTSEWTSDAIISQGCRLTVNLRLNFDRSLGPDEVHRRSNTLTPEFSQQMGGVVKFGIQVSVLLVLVFSHLACHTPKGTGDSLAPAVVITGASSGIGRATAEHLANNGYYVYAGARSSKDLDELEAIPNVKAVKLDVTIEEQIRAVATLVRDEGRPLRGLVNNAGIAVVGPLSELPTDDLSRQLDVNVLGPYRVTKAFTPLLLQHHGRVINISSLNGLVSGGFYGPYAMSKHALQAYSDSLAGELGPRGVKVATVIPGGYQSKIFDRLLAQGWNKETEFGPEMKRYIDKVSRRPARPASELVPVIKFALEDPDPMRRLYLGLSSQREGDLLMGVLFHRLAQLNHGHAHGYTRDQLIEMLDKALEKYPAKPGVDKATR